jgi:serine protease Do
MTTHNLTLRYMLAVLAAAVLAALESQPAAGQRADLATSASTVATSESRDAEFAALGRDVDALDRELGLVRRVVKLVTPTVVHIEAKPLPRYHGLLNIEEAGSGIVVQFGPDFYILTNRHVIRHSSPELIDIHLADGRLEHPARIWSDSETDVAVMAIGAQGLVPARLGDSDSLEIGEYVLAVGSPFGLSQSVTRGIISAKGRYNLDLGDGDLKWQNFIQTDAAINPGNSGGPLVNLRGEVVGLNTAIASASGGNEGIGFSIPINIVSRIAHSLVEKNEVARGYLGVKLDVRFNQQQAETLGLPRLVGTRVTGIEPNSPAERASLRINDVILEFDGVRVERDTHLISLVKLTEVGRHVDLVIFRDGQAIRTAAEIGDVRDEPADEL